MKYTNSHVVIPGLTGNLLSIWKVLPLAAVVVLLAACGDDPKVGGTEEDAGIIAIENKTVSGVSQKGPFVNGSSVTVYGLDGETLAQTGNIYEGKIRSDMGDFSVKVVKLASQYALLKANGFYRNEVTGEKSNSQMTLYALTDLSDRDEVNVNLLTHLAYERSLYLATNSMSVANAKKQAEAEVFKSFEIEGDFASAEDLNIFGENDQSAALLAISVLMQGDLKEADFSERLDNYARDIETDGVWDDKNTATFIADWASEKSLSGGLASVRANVEKWGQLFGVPPFEKYVDNFWWQNYGLGTCDAKREGEILQASNPLSVNNGVHFICYNNAWRVATDIEKDTYKWIDPTVKNTAKDGDVRYGNVVKTNCYVYEDKAWRSGNDGDCSLDLRGCTSLRQDTVGLGKDKVWYICDMKNWRTAYDIEKDTVTWGAGKFDGEVRAGQINKGIYYIYETNNKAWRDATTLEKDTYDYKENKDWTAGTDGEIKKGSITDAKYVFDNLEWRPIESLEEQIGSCTLGMVGNTASIGDGCKEYYMCQNGTWKSISQIDYEQGLCTKEKNGDRVEMVDCDEHELRYICKNNTWEWASELEYKYGLCTNEKAGDTVTVCSDYSCSKPLYYICQKNAWENVTEFEYKYGLCTNEKNGDTLVVCENYSLDNTCTTYSSYKCKNTKWMGISLMELSIPKETLFNSDVPYGVLVDKRDGREYRTVTIDGKEWMAENLDYPSCSDYFGCAYTWNGAQNACPSGWHIPSGDEWETLFAYIGESNRKMMSSTAWNVEATDDYGLSIIPAPSPWENALGWPRQSFHWSSTEYDGAEAMSWYVGDGVNEGVDKADLGHNRKDFEFYVRCVKNEK